MKEEYINRLKELFKDRYNKELDLKNPKTFNENIIKINVELTKEELAIRTKCADKYRVRDYFKEKLGKDIGVPIDHVLNDPSELRDIYFEEPHIIKCNHASGFNFKCEKGYINSKLIDIILSCMKTSWFRNAYEMWYIGIERKLITEKIIPNIRDIRAYCVDGIVKLYEVCEIDSYVTYGVDEYGKPNRIKIKKNISGESRLSYYDTEWNFIPDLVRLKFSTLPKVPDERPNQIEQMKTYAEILSTGFQFVRVDFIVSDDEFYCEELTFAPGGGFSPFKDNGDELMYQRVFG